MIEAICFTVIAITLVVCMTYLIIEEGADPSPHDDEEECDD